MYFFTIKFLGINPVFWVSKKLKTLVDAFSRSALKADQTVCIRFHVDFKSNFLTLLMRIWQVYTFFSSSNYSINQEVCLSVSNGMEETCKGQHFEWRVSLLKSIQNTIYRVHKSFGHSTKDMNVYFIKRLLNSINLLFIFMTSENML